MYKPYEHVRQYLLENRALHRAGLKDLIEWVAVNDRGEIFLIRYG